MRSQHGWQWGRSRPGCWRRDLEISLWQKRGRDMKLMSRDRLVSRRSRHETDVATWPVEN